MDRRRIAAAGIGLVVGAAAVVLAACSISADDADPGAPAPTGPAPRTSGPTDPPQDAPLDPPPGEVTNGAQGFDIRHLGEDGSIKTLKVRDFPR